MDVKIYFSEDRVKRILINDTPITKIQQLCKEEYKDKTHIIEFKDDQDEWVVFDECFSAKFLKDSQKMTVRCRPVEKKEDPFGMHQPKTPRFPPSLYKQSSPPYMLPEDEVIKGPLTPLNRPKDTL